MLKDSPAPGYVELPFSEAVYLGIPVARKNTPKLCMSFPKASGWQLWRAGSRAHRLPDVIQHFYVYSVSSEPFWAAMAPTVRRGCLYGALWPCSTSCSPQTAAPPFPVLHKDPCHWRPSLSSYFFFLHTDGVLPRTEIYGEELSQLETIKTASLARMCRLMQSRP